MKQIWFAVLAITVLIFTGCQQQTTDQSQKQENVAMEPDQTYLNNCASCHGQNLEGGLGPSLQKIGSKLSKEEIEDIIKNGKNSMPSQPQVSEQARSKLSEWLAEKK